MVSDCVAEAKIRYRSNLCESLDNYSSNISNYLVIIKKLLGKEHCPSIPALEHSNTYALSDLEKNNVFLDKFTSNFHHRFYQNVP
jgi:hypothetical protein